MAIKTFKPYTPARRNMTVSGFDGVDKQAKPERSLVETLKKHAGRNSYGRITVRHHGGGNKRKYRIIDQCVAQGVPFAREYGGLLDNRSFGGAQVSRTFYAKGKPDCMYYYCWRRR